MRHFFETQHPFVWSDWFKGHHLKQIAIFFTVLCAALLAIELSHPPQNLFGSKDTTVTIPVQFVANARPVKTWGELCKLQNLCALTGIQVAPETMKKVGSLYMVGDRVAATWGKDKGRIFVTMYNPMHELRVTWEPENGKYISTKRFVLKRNGSATSVEYWDRYAGESELHEAIINVSQINALRVKDFAGIFG